MGNKQALALAAQHQLLFEAVENALRNLGGVGRAAVAGADLLYARAENHRVDQSRRLLPGALASCNPFLHRQFL